MTTGLNANLLRKMEGLEFELDGVPVRFERGVRGKPATMKGGEGYACPVTRLDTHELSILKIFLLPTPERQLRTRFLSRLRLSSIPLSFQPFVAAPRGFVGGVVDLGEEGRFDIEGWLAPKLNSSSLRSRLLSLDWNPSVTARQRVATELCMAIEVLENGAGLAHGDLSGDNVYIEGSGDALDVRLIDFDGFYHPDVPLVPCSDDEGGRKTGTDGYRAAAYSRLAQDECVRSDRVALAILLMELLVLRGEDLDDELDRETLLDQGDIDAGVLRVPAALIERWPAGFELLERALAAHDPAAAPSPGEWRRLIARVPPTDDSARPSRSPSSQQGAFLVLIREQHQPDREVRLHGGSGTFAALHPDLGWLAYQATPAGLQLFGEVPWSDGIRPNLLVRRGGAQGELQRRRELTLQLTVDWSDWILWGRFELIFSNLVMPDANG